MNNFTLYWQSGSTWGAATVAGAPFLLLLMLTFLAGVMADTWYRARKRRKQSLADALKARAKGEPQS